jgi:hypothetical protein
MLEAGAPVPYVQDQVGHEDPKTTLSIYAQVLRRRDRRRHGQAFDAIMTGAVPSNASIMVPNVTDHPRSRQALQMPPVPSASGHRNATNDHL